MPTALVADRDQAIDALAAAGFTIENDPELDRAGETIIHTIGRMFGADWNLNAAVEFIRDADTVEWVADTTGHCLHATKDERFIRFDVPMPQEVR